MKRLLARNILCQYRSKRFSSDGSKSTTIPPDFKSDLLDNSIVNDDRLTTTSQDFWTSPTYHQEDMDKIRPSPKRMKNKKYKPPIEILDIDHSENSILLFPGQGCQYVGMGQKAIDKAPATKDLFQRASTLLGYDLLDLCLNGPKETLDRTEYCQPAILVSSLAAVEALWEYDEDAVKNCIATAGFSVGELTALIFSGALSFEDGLRLVQVRGQAMQEASDLESSGMMTIFHHSGAKVGLACDAAKKWIKDQHQIEYPVCSISNLLYAGCKVIGGHNEALEFIENNKKDFGIRKTKRIPVSGAFHTQLMNPAVEAFTEALKTCAIASPRIPVYSNVDGQVYRSDKHVWKILPKQIVVQVKWETAMNNLMKYKSEDQWPRIIECGPGTSLISMLRIINGKMAKGAMVMSA